MENNYDIICYHKNCPDGIGGLWAANHYKEIPIHYPLLAGENPSLEDIEDKKILFVDVCPKDDYILFNIEKVKKMTILDHHKSSKEMLDYVIKKNIPNLEIIFDMDRSGAKIAWDYFFPNTPCPFFIKYIQDKDLWRWKLLHSREINFAMDSYLELEKLDSLLEDEDLSFENLLEEGKILQRENDKKIQTVAEKATKEYFLCNDKLYNIVKVNNIRNKNLTSDLGNYLCEKHQNVDFAVIKSRGVNYWSYSLRGIKGKCPDLSFIAKQFGGGGHPSSAAMRIYDVEKRQSPFIKEKQNLSNKICHDILPNQKKTSDILVEDFQKNDNPTKISRTPANSPKLKRL